MVIWSAVWFWDICFCFVGRGGWFEGWVLCGCGGWLDIGFQPVPWFWAKGVSVGRDGFVIQLVPVFGRRSGRLLYFLCFCVFGALLGDRPSIGVGSYGGL